MLKKFLSCKKAATAIEYALLAGLFAVICIAAYTQLTGDMGVMYDTLSDKISGASSSYDDE